MNIFTRRCTFVSLITILILFIFTGVTMAQDNTVTSGGAAIGSGNQAMGQGQGQMIIGPLLPPGNEIQTLRGNRPFLNPGGLILPGFPTNVDTNGGKGAMYLDTRTQLGFKNSWTVEELNDANSRWLGNKAEVSMVVSKTKNKPSIVEFDYVRQIKNKDGSFHNALPLDTKTYDYRFVGYTFVRATSQNLMSPENTIDSARKMRQYGANYGVVMNDGVEKTMIAKSFGIALGYTHSIIATDEQAAGTGTAGIGYSNGSSGMKGFPYIQVVAFVRTLKADKAAKIVPTTKPKIKTNVTNLKDAAPQAAPAKITPVKTHQQTMMKMMKPAVKAKPVTFKSNVKGLVPALDLN